MLIADKLSERLARRREMKRGRNPIIPATIPAAIAASMLSFPSVAGHVDPKPHEAYSSSGGFMYRFR